MAGEKKYPTDKNVSLDGPALKSWADGGKRQSDDPKPPAAPAGDDESSGDLRTFNLIRDALEWRKTYDPERDGNPPSFVDDEGLWDKAMDAAEAAGADDEYAFANWWYHEHA